MAQPRYTPDDSHAVKHHERFRDPSKTHQQLFNTLKQVEVAVFFTIGLCVVPMVLPHAVWASVLLLPVVVYRCVTAEENITLPLKLPEEMGKTLDKHDNQPGKRWQYNYAQGTVLLGNQQLTDKELWLSGGDLLTHALVIGTTGAGKTVALVGLAAATAFCRGGGLIYIDAKAGPDLLYEISALCRVFGREDDLRAINYSLAGVSTKRRNYKKLSNTTSPFAHGTDSQMVTTLTDTMPSGGEQNQFFSQRAIACLKILAPALCELRDMGVLTIRPSTITEFMSVRKFMELAQNKIIVAGEERPGFEIRENTRKPIETFLKQLGVDFDKPPQDQDPKVLEQFSYAEGYFSLTMANFSGTFGHIYEHTALAEADFVDVVLHNRILLVAIPAMQQSSEEISSLGKIVLAALKVALSQGLGGDNAGDYEDTIGSLPVDQRVPTVTIIDEYPAIVVEGFATAATQGRSVGMVCVFSGQDFPGFTGASATEADQIFGSTRLKMLLATEDAGSTLKKFQELAGKQAVAEGHGWERSDGFMDAYRANVGASIHEVERIDIKEINEQDKGEGHIFYRGKVIRSNLFYTGIDSAQVKDNFRYNQMLPIEYPEQSVLDGMVKLRRQVRYLEQVADFNLDQIDLEKSIELGYWAENGGDHWPTKILLRFNTNQKPLSENKPVQHDTVQQLQDTVDLLNEVDQTYDEPSPSINLDEMPGNVETHPNDDLEEAIFAADAPPDSGRDIDDFGTSEWKDALGQTKNSWVFTALASASNNPNRCEDIVDALSELNVKIGMDEIGSRGAAVSRVRMLAEDISYPSQPIEAKTDDADDLFKAIEELSKNK